MSKSHFGDFNRLRNTFGSVDYVGGLYVFNAGPYRLIAAIHFDRQKVFVAGFSRGSTI
ncbi:MAG: type II toxin-antitoxin system HigB family toxin [Burkholderiales bacterium]|nr:type II toxin-antitoxin system HigB family toxin [Burkholderiales bacterium]